MTLRVRDLRVSAGPVRITTGVDLDVGPGEVVGLVGESGSGKSLTVRACLGLLPPGLHAEGSVQLDGEELLTGDGGAMRRARGSGMALLLQDPATALDPLQRVGDQVGIDGDLGTARARLAEVGLDHPELVRRFPFELSGGQRQRVAIAAAIAGRPSVLLADEPTSALDGPSARVVLDLLARLREDHGMGVLLVTHDLGLAFSASDRVHVLYAGAVVESGSATTLAHRPSHPYTRALLAAAPPLGHRVAELRPLDGAVPRPDRRPTGCPFAPRCSWVQERCRAAPVPPTDLGDGHQVRCLRVGEAPLPTLATPPAATPTAHAAPVRQPAPADAVVRVRGLSVRFGDHVALDGVDLDVPAGSAIGVVGASGAGKTTLARCVVSLQEPTAGTIEVAGVALRRGLRRRDRERVRATVQMVFQDPAASLNPALRIGAILEEAAALAPRPGRTVEELLALVGLPADHRHDLPSRLSGGERQRVAIARALARAPRLLVCDEPLGSLDVSVGSQVLDLLRQLRRDLGLAILLISHDLAAVRQVCDEVHVLDAGRVIEHGPTASVLDTPRDPTTRRLVAAARHR